MARKTVQDRSDWEIKLDILNAIQSLDNTSIDIEQSGTRPFVIKRGARVEGNQFSSYIKKMLDDGLIVTRTLDTITYYFRTDKGTQWQTSMQDLREQMRRLTNNP